MRAWLARVTTEVDARDVTLGVGLLLLGGGLALVSVPAALAVPGLVLVAVAVFGVKGA